MLGLYIKFACRISIWLDTYIFGFLQKPSYKQPRHKISLSENINFSVGILLKYKLDRIKKNTSFGTTNKNLKKKKQYIQINKMFNIERTYEGQNKIKRKKCKMLISEAY